MDETEWLTVSLRRRGPKTDRKCRVVNRSEFALSSSKYAGAATACIRSGAVDPQQKARAESAAQAIEQLAEETQVSALWEEIRRNLKNAVYAELASLRGAGTSSTSFISENQGAASSPAAASKDDLWGAFGRVSFSLVCLGLGSPTDCSDVLSCRYQLALGMLLRKLLRIPRGRVQVQDPVMNETDALVLSALSLCPHAEGEVTEEESVGFSEAPPEFELTVYLAPHCDADLYGDLLGLELGLQPFCLRCFSCAAPSSSSSHNDADATQGISLLRNSSGHSRQKTQGFILIANLLSSYELRRSFFGELNFVEHLKKISCQQPCGEEEGCSEAAARESALKTSGGSLSATQQKQKEQGLYSPAVCCFSESTVETQKQMQSPQCQQVANEPDVARCPCTPRRSGDSNVNEERLGSVKPSKLCRNSINGEVRDFCQFVTVSRGALLLLELLPYVDEWPLKGAFSAYPRAFNDLSVSRFPTPRTDTQRAEFWRNAIQRRQHLARHPRGKKDQRLQRNENNSLLRSFVLQ
ncbi:hypothetical protein Esti_006844 [Eimeria stiedai]